MKKALTLLALCMQPLPALATEPCPRHTPLHYIAYETTDVVEGTGLFFKGVLIDVHDGAVVVVDLAHDGVVDTATFVHDGATTVTKRVFGCASEVVGGLKRGLGRLFPLPTCRCKDCRKTKTRRVVPAPPVIAPSPRSYPLSTILLP
jgi:hypothetical protein